MNTKLEFHDSIIESLEMSGDAILMLEAYIRGDKVGWYQNVSFQFQGAEIEGHLPENSGQDLWLRGGYLKCGGTEHDLVPVPFDCSEPTELRVDFMYVNSSLIIRSRGITLRFAGEPGEIEAIDW